MSTDVAVTVQTVLGPPKRYAYRAQPITLYINREGKLEKFKGYNVDFEIACDEFDIDEARGSNCLYNPHLINISEPGVGIDVVNPYISHSVILDDAHYNLLKSVTNSDGNLHRYNGVVEAYSIQDIKSKFNRADIPDTGICLTENIKEIGGLRKPDVPFNEKRHTRYIQASESYRLKLKKSKTSLVLANIYEPKIYELAYNDIYNYGF